MKVPLSWVREYVDSDLPPKELAHRLTMAGTETESITEIGADWERVVVVQVVDLDRHPNADNLLIAKVDRGDGTSTIVTGAPNLAVGQKVPLVMAGGKLAGGVEIGRRTFRGITSEGMLCAGDELGLSADHDGIYILEDDAPVGEELRRLLGEVVLDLYITPNRADCMSIIGVAREIQALTGNRMRRLQWAPPTGESPAAALCRVEVADPDLAPRYSATVIRDLEIRPSPPWMQRRLYFAGVRPISNVVDITNYVMLETGQPMHAFDGGKLEGGIVVRRARAGERITTLDDQERALGPDMLVIADRRVPVGVAGVMGGANTEIGPETKLVVLESANFNPASIRRTSQELGLKTEASRRFERGLDPGLTVPSAARATQLMVELANGRPAGGVIDVYPRPEEPRRITLRLGDLERLLGKRYERDEVVRVLENLEFAVAPSDAALEVVVPGHRRDVERKADLIEEVARISGYDAIPEVIFQGRIPEPTLDRERLLEERAKLTLGAAGCQEVINYSLVHPSQAAQLDLRAAWPPPEGAGSDLIRVSNPMSVERSALRQTLLGGLLENVWANLRYRDRVWCFELARVYLPPLDPLPREPRRLAVALSGPRRPASWASPPEATDFADLKGILEQLLDRLGVHGVVYRPTEHPTLQTGRTAELVVGPPGAPRPIGVAGQLHPLVADRFDLEGRAVMLAELDFDALCELASDALTSTRLPEHPDLKLDLALVIDEAITHEQVLEELRQAGGELLADVQLFDVYRGPPIPEGKKSHAYALSFRAPDRTLTDAEVAPHIDAIELRLAERLGARIRRG
jgi:phenylalanyl-tRNA synthetase beta chain